MENPFEKRATEWLRDEEAFLAVVSPEPVGTFLSGRDLYDPLVVVRGTPGSGKTTLAKLFQYPTVTALLRNSNFTSYKAIVAALTECGAISEDEEPLVLGCRLPMETDYREIWQFPYPDELKLGLMHTLIQARAVLAWMRNLKAGGVEVADVRIIPRGDAEAATEAIGGIRGPDLLARARAVELALYRISAALVTPDPKSLPAETIGAYRPFDVIDRFQIAARPGDRVEWRELRPLMVLDDAHILHPAQFQGLHRWLARREVRVSRWILTRLDLLSPQEAFAAASASDPPAYGELPGITKKRDVTEIMLQGTGENRRAQRLAFRKMARDMAGRYLRQHGLFAAKGLGSLSDLLRTDPDPLPPSKLRDLREDIDRTQVRLSISASRRASLEQEIVRYEGSMTADVPSEDLRLGMLRVLMHRYVKRTPQVGMFADDPEPNKPLTADADILAAAQIQLLHQYGRPYYYGIEDLCDASSENAEQFLRLAALLVEHAATQIVRRKDPAITTGTQSKLMQQRAREILRDWSFPHHQLLRLIVALIAQRCVERTIEPNAPLSSGANAYGVRQPEFDRLAQSHPDLAKVLQFGLAYNALTLVPNHVCKGERWCLFELGGIVALSHGLTLKRGGFLEGSVDELARIIEGGGA
jgi:hypothetical protein